MSQAVPSQPGSAMTIARGCATFHIRYINRLPSDAVQTGWLSLHSRSPVQGARCMQEEKTTAASANIKARRQASCNCFNASTGKSYGLRIIAAREKEFFAVLEQFAQSS